MSKEIYYDYIAFTDREGEYWEIDFIAKEAQEEFQVAFWKENKLTSPMEGVLAVTYYIKKDFTYLANFKKVRP